MGRACSQETRSVSLAAQLSFIAQGAEMIIAGIAITGLSIGRADAVSKLGDLKRRPVELWHGRDDPGDNAGFTHAA
jgi:hypothetical protein